MILVSKEMIGIQPIRLPDFYAGEWVNSYALDVHGNLPLFCDFIILYIFGRACSRAFPPMLHIGLWVYLDHELRPLAHMTIVRTVNRWNVINILIIVWIISLYNFRLHAARFDKGRVGTRPLQPKLLKDNER
jgi:hypothetical protein